MFFPPLPFEQYSFPIDLGASDLVLANNLPLARHPRIKHADSINVRMRPQFSREQVNDLDLEERHVQNMMRALDVSMQADKWTDIVDLQVLFFRLTLDSATEFLFGQSVDSQLHLIPGYRQQSQTGAADALASDFAAAFDKGQMALATRARFMEQYWLVSPKGFKESCKVCHDFIDHFVRLALSNELREKGFGRGQSGAKEKYIFLEVSS